MNRLENSDNTSRIDVSFTDRSDSDPHSRREPVTVGENVIDILARFVALEYWHDRNAASIA
tara:strand:+ start:506 stop:688 length:183 start_codon:yes stop_codon:yes gene_type:complete